MPPPVLCNTVDSPTPACRAGGAVNDFVSPLWYCLTYKIMKKDMKGLDHVSHVQTSFSSSEVVKTLLFVWIQIKDTQLGLLYHNQKDTQQFCETPEQQALPLLLIPQWTQLRLPDSLMLLKPCWCSQNNLFKCLWFSGDVQKLHPSQQTEQLKTFLENLLRLKIICPSSIFYHLTIA